MTSLGLVLRCCVKVRIRVSVRVKASFGLGCRVSFRVRVRVPGTNIACVSVENQREWVFKCQHMSYCRTLSEQSLLFNCVHQFFIVLLWTPGVTVPYVGIGKPTDWLANF